MSLLGAILCAATPLLFFQFSMMGGADVKLLASLGALLLPREGLVVEFVAFAAAATLLPARLAYRGHLFSTLLGTVTMIANPLRPRQHRPTVPEGLRDRVHFCPFILVGMLFATLVAAAQ
jgi:Flp pilus assembly protein protease CpaA